MDFVVAVLIIALSCIVLLPFFKTYRKNRRIAKYIDILPGEKWYPIIGTALTAIKCRREDYFDLIINRTAIYGPFLRMWFGSLPVVQIYKPEHAQVIFKSNVNISKGFVYKFLFPWLGQGLISGSGPKWRMHRKVITPAFHFKMLDVYGEIFRNKSEHFANYLERFVGKGYFEVVEILNRIALDIICEAAMGVELNFLDKTEGEEFKYAQALTTFCALLNKRFRNPLLSNDFVFSKTKSGKVSQNCVETLHKFNANVIRKRRAYYQEHKSELKGEDEFGRKQKLFFLDMLLDYQEKHGFADQEIEEEVNTFMFGGQDTTSYTVTYALMALGNNLDVQKKVQEELDAVFADDPTRPMTSQDLTQFEYLDRVLKEVLRCYSFVPLLARELHEDIEIDGVFLPAGVNIFINLYALHHDPDHFPDPLKFDPDRFLPDNAAKMHPYAFVPFSAGPRNCLGQKFGVRNSKTLLVSILRRFTVTCQEKPEDIKYYAEIVMRPQNGIHIALEPRNR